MKKIFSLVVLSFCFNNSYGNKNNIESRKKQKLMKILKQQQIITEEKLKDLDLPVENP